MKILAFDTTMAACSAAVVRFENGEAQVMSAHHETRTRGHAEVLVPMIGEVMAQASVSFGDLDRIAVTVGPGTFTGVRVGVATARGMAVASGLPVVGITTFEAVAAGVAASPGAEHRPIACVFDARRDEVYVQCFTAGLVALTEPQALPYRDAGELITAHQPVLVGTGVHLVMPLEDGDRASVPIADVADQPTAVLVAERAALGVPATGPPVPLYLRPPDAKLPK